jgi:hypothetical protein
MPLKGAEFVAVVRLMTRDGVVAQVGERCDYVPVDSLAWLLEQGKIAPAPKAEPVKKGRA